MPSTLSSWMGPSKPNPQTKNQSKPKKNRLSLLTQIVTQSKDQPIRPSEYPYTPESGPPAVLINIDYQGNVGAAKLKLYDTTSGQIYEWLDNTGHLPYCLTDLSREDLSQQNDVVGHSGFLKFEEGSKYNLLRDSEEQYTIIVAKDPLAIGGRPDSIREKIGRDHAWEADIRYTQCYTMDRALTPGLLYRVQKGRLVPVPQEFSAEDATKIRGLFKDDKELSKLIEEYLPLFLTPASSLPRLAIDIEVESEFIDRIPDPEQAPQPIISVAVVDDTGVGRVLLLEQGSQGREARNLPDTVTVEKFADEKALIEMVFRILWRTPVLLTFNGDNFDLRYLVNRAKKLGIPPADNPVRLRGGFRGNPEAELEYGVHIDLYRFFHNRSIQIYAFRNRYSEVRLETVSQALLGEGKLPLPDEINKIPAHLLAQYNWQDASLTMRLSTFDDDLIMSLILLLMRISHQGMHDLTRAAVSNWIRSLLYYAHRQRNYLIPRQDEIASLKGEAVTEAIIKGKKYMGAIVVEPKEGVHFNVTLVDFACLSEDTEILTNLGWLSLDSVRAHSNNGAFLKIATVNPLSSEVEFQPLGKLHEYDYQGELYNFACGGVDLLVTPNHRMVFNRRTNKRDRMEWSDSLELEEAQKLCERYWFKIPQFGNWVGRSHNVNFGRFTFTPDQFLPFLGWLLTDGSFDKYSVRIHQSKEKNFQHIRNSINLLGFKFTEKEYTSGQGRKYHRFDINDSEFANALRNWLDHELGGRRKGIPRTILNFEKEHLQLLFDSLLLGDGSWSRGKCHSFSSITRRFVDEFQELALRLGYGCQVKHEIHDCEIDEKVYRNHESYRAFLSYFRQNVFSGQRQRIWRLPYQGKVWCVSVPNGTIIARRNGKPAVTGNSLYPSIMKAYNLSYETVRCDHPECKDNLVPDTPHWVCTRREGITSLIIGLIRDVRVEHFKPRAKDKTLEPAQRSWFSVVEQALKVFLNACLPSNEEVIIRTPTGQVQKREIASLKDCWAGLEVLSINANANNGHFGTPIFVPIKGFAETGKAKVLKITLSDGRQLRCTANHVIPIYTTQTGRRYGKTFRIDEIPAGELKTGDELLLCSQMPFTEPVPDRIFIPDLIDSTNLLIGMERSVYKQFSYRKGQQTDNELITIINRKFEYSKVQKIYKAYWDDLSEEERDVIRNTSPGLLVAKIARSHRSPGFWQDLCIPLSEEFFQLLGWYVAEGHGQQNRFSLTQSFEKNPENIAEILSLLKQLGWPAVFYSDKTITVHSNVISSVICTLCGTHAVNKRLPLSLLNKTRAEVLLKSYFKGDGNFTLKGSRRYSTASQQLVRDLLFLLSALGRFTSLHRDSDITRIVETKGKNYTRKYQGLMDFNGTNLVRVKSIEIESDTQKVFDIETGNGWFVTTNGVVTHNSYGVLGASHFPLYCAPAAESITALGRYAITQTIEKAEELGVTVLYGDTDSLFLDNPTNDQLKRLIDYSEKELRVELDVEKEYRYVALSSRKKNYLGVSKDGQVDIKGLTGKKRNTPLFLQKAFMEMIDILSQVRDPDGFASAKKRILQLARDKLTMLDRREFDVEDLAIRVQLTKNLSAYTKTTPQHVKAATQLQKAGKEVTAGDIIAFVKTTDGVKPVEQATAQDIDVSKYKDLVKSTFEQVLDALGIEWLDTIGMRRLDTFFG
ncbi:MAG: DNA polymerase domain-containing protein [Promethearchaeota archaeon]